MDTVRASTLSERPVPLSVPTFGGNEARYLRECVETGWVSSAGPFVERFERAIAAYVGSQHAVAVINGTAALHTALRVVGVQPEDEVLVSDLTFVAPVNAIRYCQAHPVLVGPHQATWQMDPDAVEQFLTRVCERRQDALYDRRTGRRVRALLPVHILGLACDMGRLADLARRFHLRIVEDAAEAVGVRWQGRHVGTFGDVGVFSFNGNKIITAGGGGVVVTNDAEAARYARYLTTQAKDDPVEHLHHEVGYNYRLSNLHAALGLAQLEQLDAFVAKKRAIAQRYQEAFRAWPGITPMPTTLHTQATYWLYTILLEEGTSLMERQAVIRRLHAVGIGARPLWCPMHRLAPYRRCQSIGIHHAERLYERAVSLPCSVGLSDQDVQRCVEALRECVVAHDVLR